MLFTVLTSKQVAKYLLPSSETRIEFYSFLATKEGIKYIIPFYYFSVPQKNALLYVDIEIVKSTVLEQFKRLKPLITKKSNELSILGFSITGLSILDNLHSHPAFTPNFSEVDYAEDGCLRSAYEQEGQIGLNLLYSFPNGDFLEAVVRHKTSLMYQYYTPLLSEVEKHGFKPVFNIKKRHYEPVYTPEYEYWQLINSFNSQ